MNRFFNQCFIQFGDRIRVVFNVTVRDSVGGTKCTISSSSPMVRFTTLNVLPNFVNPQSTEKMSVAVC